MWAIGFAYIFAFDKDIEDAHISSVEVQVKLMTLEPTEQTWANIPSSVERKAVSTLHSIAVPCGFPVHRFHQEQFEIIG